MWAEISTQLNTYSFVPRKRISCEKWQIVLYILIQRNTKTEQEGFLKAEVLICLKYSSSEWKEILKYKKKNTIEGNGNALLSVFGNSLFDACPDWLLLITRGKIGELWILVRRQNRVTYLTSSQDQVRLGFLSLIFRFFFAFCTSSSFPLCLTTQSKIKHPRSTPLMWSNAVSFFVFPL